MYHISAKGARLLLARAALVNNFHLRGSLYAISSSRRQFHHFKSGGKTVTAPYHSSSRHQASDTPIEPKEISSELSNIIKIQRLVNSYRERGHYKAKIDPLSAYEISAPDIGAFGFSEADLDRSFQLPPDILPNFPRNEGETLTLAEILANCEKTYCGTYGVEIEHVEDPVQRQWLLDRLETPDPVHLSRDDKLRILNGLTWATGFERLLATKFPTAKRYGMDGVESLLPAVETLVNHNADHHGVEDFIFGTCHRGRLTLCASIYGLPPEALIAEFMGRPGWGLLPGTSGDVKTHLGLEAEHSTPENNKANISVLANPSHLESIDPVAQGAARAVQRMRGSDGRKKTLCLEFHGDAAFTGQGVVYETLSLSKIPAYDVGGTLRMIVNNQIGFTANPQASRSTPYASDIAKFLSVPIFHVNSDDPEAVVFVCKLASDWRAEFGTDVVIDLICYRRYGHNELDQPRFTQPLQYKKIDAHPTTEALYTKKLIEEGTLSSEEAQAQKTAILEGLNQNYEDAKTYKVKMQSPPKAWKNLPDLGELASKTYPQGRTAIDPDMATNIIEKVTTPPPEFKAHRNIKRILDTRKSAFKKNLVDWTAGEALAFGSLALEGFPVRVLGEDAQRATFSQRHAVLHDQESGETWTPLAELAPEESRFLIENSPLSEYGALGFEYGYSVFDPSSLVVWEAQFGDFVNTAQVILDNFLAAAETKWGDRSGLVLTLPHGYDGQGPEHSSSRMERFLMMSSENGREWPTNLERQHQDCNIQVIYPTTPANYFHALRRQLHREYRKPLIVLFSKSLLRHPLNRSTLEEFTGDSAFQPVLRDPEDGKTIADPDSISRVLICTGQVYATLHKHREENNIKDTTIVRVEELNPFPFAQLKEALECYPNAKTFAWVQEEHYNGGGWHHARDRVTTVLQHSSILKDKTFVYVGRTQSQSTAAGSRAVHLAEEAKFVEEAFTVGG